MRLMSGVDLVRPIIFCGNAHPDHARHTGLRVMPPHAFKDRMQITRIVQFDHALFGRVGVGQGKGAQKRLEIPGLHGVAGFFEQHFRNGPGWNVCAFARHYVTPAR